MENAADLEVRTQLEAERTAVVDQLASIPGRGDGPEAFDDGFADSGQVAAEVGEAWALAGKLEEQLRDVERALARLDAGTYGQCERCGQPIGDQRLEAMPTASRCINCAG